MRTTQGWIQTQRLYYSDSPDNPFRGDGLLLLVWQALLSWARWEDEQPDPLLGREPLKRGQIWTTYTELITQLGITEDQLRWRLKKLAKMGYISQQTHQKGMPKRRSCPTVRTTVRTTVGTLITVCNYDEIFCIKDERPTVRTTVNPTIERIYKNKSTLADADAPPPEPQLFPGDEPQKTETPRKPSRTPRKAKDPTPGTETWVAYCEALRRRNIEPPVRDAKTNAQCVKLVQLAGGSLTRTIELVNHYVDSNRYYDQGWSLGFLVAAAQGILNKLQAQPPISKLSDFEVAQPPRESAEDVRNNKYLPEVNE